MTTIDQIADLLKVAKPLNDNAKIPKGSLNFCCSVKYVDNQQELMVH